MFKFLIGYNDDNHNTMFWFNREYIGDDTAEIAEQMFAYGMEEGIHSEIQLATVLLTLDVFADAGLNDDEIDILHRYLCYPRAIDKYVWKVLTEKDFKLAIQFIKNL